MQIFWYELLFFIVAAFVVLVSLSSATLFLVTYRYEKSLRTVWRTMGFVFVGVAFVLLLLERKFDFFELPALIFMLAGFFSIYRGVFAELDLSHLKKINAKQLLWRK